MQRFPAHRLLVPVARRATVPAVVLVLGAACASTGTAPVESAAATSQNTIRLDGGSGAAYQVQLTHSDRPDEADLTAPPDRAYAALPLVYEQLGLKINTAVSERRTIGVNSVRIRRVGKDPMSRFLSCGNDATGGPVADSYGITLTVLSRVTPAVGGTGSLLSTQVIGTAQPMSTSGSLITCQSTGELEARIAKATILRSAS